MPSVQSAPTHTLPVQTAVVQSPGPAHVLPAAHLGQVPPQSLSVSLPFFTVSLQAGAAQTPALHTPLSQSVPTVHLPPGAHGLQVAPPQSRSVSLPFFTPSAQFAV
jgi:hypothetical protein